MVILDINLNGFDSEGIWTRLESMKPAMSPITEVPDDNDREQCLVDEICASSSRAPIHNLLFNDKYSDITIICSDREFKAHRAIVCTQCAFFENAFASAPKKRIVRSFKLEAGEPEVFQRLLEFLYTGSYTDEGDSLPQDNIEAKTKDIQERLNCPPRCPLPSNNASSESSQHVRRSIRLKSNAEPMAQMEGVEGQEPAGDPIIPEPSTPPEITLALKIYLMADKYDVPALKLLARDRFYMAAKAHWVTKSWEGSSWDNTQVFEDVVLEVFISTRPDDTAIWKALCKLIAIKDEGDIMKRRMEEVMSENNDLASGVLEYEKEWGGKG
ncbi:hypothetical protein FSARC_8409 [Fusarium sarcochroum]|uniref:BTB domain-containing protein n=1 Tax=Fusarium sarcochroum TaxID=1208366 RepID=A0A8H4TTE9_9HYPO|nr:hypothetical protein FSARC_8409 [Fusarium sarcochroum]